MERPFTSRLLTPSLPTLSICFFTNLLASSLAGQSRFNPLFLARLQVEGVALYLFNDVFRLHFTLEAAQSILEGFTLLQSNFRQTKHTPKSARKDRIFITRI
jgi:hypothetical protein